MAVITEDSTTVEQRLVSVLDVARANAGSVDAEGAFPTETIAALRSSGLLGLTVSEGDGGLGAGPREFVQVVSALAEACGSSAMIYLMHVSAVACITGAPPPGIPHVLSRLASGDWLG
ncbi:MAG TPA: acyl-CoA dehydrogenase family protein, partial [Candidatus Dormibacteraeota bacterium]